MEIGNILGLSQDMQFDQRINDARYQNMQLERSKASAAASAKAFADEFSQGPLGSKYDDQLIKSYTKQRMNDAVQVIKNNPNYKYNPDALAQLKAIKDDIKGNEHVQRGIAFVDAKKKLNADLAEVAKNPQMHDQQAYQDLIQQVNNYNEYGNQFGPEAAQKEGAKPFVYQKPKDFIDITENFRKMGDSFDDLLVGNLKGGGLGAYQEYSNPATLKANAEQLYSQNKRQFDLMAREKGVDPIKFIMTGIDGYVKKKRDFGDYALQKEMAVMSYRDKLEKQKAGMFAPPETNSYEMEIAKKNHSQVSPEQMRELVDSDSPTFLIGSKGKQINLTGIVDSKPTGYNFYPDPKGEDPKLRGIKYAEATSYMPFEEGIKQGIVKEGGMIFGDDEVVPEFQERVKIIERENKDGKKGKVLLVTTHIPFTVNNSSNAGRFNAKVMTSKQRPMPEESYQGQPQSYGGIAVGAEVRNKKDGKIYVMTANGPVLKGE